MKTDVILSSQRRECDNVVLIAVWEVNGRPYELEDERTLKNEGESTH
jgi:hypothetical protein